MVDNQIINTYFDKENIDKIIEKLRNKNYSDFKKPLYYELSLLRKGTNEKDIIETYPQFERVKIINVRRLKYGDIGHDLHYELDDETFIIIAICMEKQMLINAFHAKKNFKKFKERLFNAYKKEY